MVIGARIVGSPGSDAGLARTNRRIISRRKRGGMTKSTKVKENMFSGC